MTESLISPLLYYNLWILVWLVLQFVETLLLSSLPPLLGRILVAGIIWTSMLAAILWGSSYLSFTLRAIHAAHPLDQLRRIQKGVLIMVGVTALASAALLLSGLDAWIRLLSRGLASLIFPAVAVFSLRLLLSAHQREDTDSWRNLKLLGAAYSLIFLTLTALVWWNRFSPTIPRTIYIPLTVGLEILYNLVTVLWIHLFDRKLPAQDAADPAALPSRPAPQATLNGFGISKRESEVIQLICQGRTNQEIADALFISLKTVKDHNYRIFQKTGVRNRVELVQLAQELLKSEQAG
ncbi:helix-turn-helix transcriptional regulator [Geothrix limicola]|uniref:helix-turn-helix transcriptional regulator n=1 Tax=Geothrix limicola TaxID=2927978 RepID=UPI002556A90E|nr:helix-turn-helix transcriptional regulator [Geothrix limicola]